MISRSTNIRAALRSRQRGYLLNPYRFASAADPLYSKTVALLHMEGTVGARPLGDSSALGVSGWGLSFIGSATGAEVSTAKSLFGTRSARISLPGQFVNNSNSPSPYHFTGGEFCVEFAFNSDTLLDSSSIKQLAGIWLPNSNSAWGCDYYLGNLRFYVATSPTNSAFAASISYAMTFSADTWHRIAIAGDATNFYLFANGTLVGTTGRVNVPSPPGVRFTFGGYGITGQESYSLIGYYDEIRVTMGAGACRHTTDYTLAAGPFPNL